MTPDYTGLRGHGIDGIIHEATYPPFVRDAKYVRRQNSATKAGLLWGAYHFGNASDGTKQADHFLSAVRAGMDASPSDSGVLLILDAEKNPHYPGGTMQVKQAVDFIRRVHDRTGVYPGVYPTSIGSMPCFTTETSTPNRAPFSAIAGSDCKLHLQAGEDRPVAQLDALAIHRRWPVPVAA